MDDCIASMSRSIVPVGCNHGGLWCYGVDSDCEGSSTIPVEYTVGVYTVSGRHEIWGILVDVQMEVGTAG